MCKTCGCKDAESFEAKSPDELLTDREIVFKYFTQWRNNDNPSFNKAFSTDSPIKALNALSPKDMKIIVKEQKEYVGEYRRDWEAESFEAEDMITITGIDWETDGKDVDLPTTMDVPADLEEDEIADYLSDQKGWLVNGFVMGAESFEAEIMGSVGDIENHSVDKYKTKHFLTDKELSDFLIKHGTNHDSIRKNKKAKGNIIISTPEGGWISEAKFSLSQPDNENDKDMLMIIPDDYLGIHQDAESFEAHDPSHIYPSEELTPSHSHSSETFKSSNNNNNTMAAESKFDKLSDKIAKQYRKKGMSAKEAKEIGNKTAYTIGRKKYGKAGMAKKARAGMSAESFEAQGNPDKRTTTQYAKFYVGFEDDEGELRGGGKFKKYNDAVSQAEIVSKREGNSRVVSTRGFALWTDDGKGMFQEGYDKTVAKEFYSAEGYSIGSGFRLGFGLGLGMLALSTVTTIVALAASTIDERQVEK